MKPLRLVSTVKSRPALRKLARILHRLVELRPYYIYDEGAGSENITIKPRLDGCKASWLDQSNLPEICSRKECGYGEQTFQSWLDEGHRLFGVKHAGQIVAYTWCNLNDFEFQGLQVPLTPNQAYLFEAVTFSPFRGKGIAPFMRHQLHGHLRAMGRDTIYSISDAFNEPSVRFKQKLGARPLRLNLHFSLFNKFSRHILLKEYSRLSPVSATKTAATTSQS